jgi:hypothetical protein
MVLEIFFDFCIGGDFAIKRKKHQASIRPADNRYAHPLSQIKTITIIKTVRWGIAGERSI